MYHVYILQSVQNKGFYIGHSQSPKERLILHNKGRIRSTKSKRPWKLIYEEAFNTKQNAYRRELQMKSFKGGEAFKKLIKL